MEKDWNGCRKEECGMWGRVEMRDCPLASNGKAWCVATGEFFIPRPQEPVVKYEGLRRFTILDMAQAGICHGKITRFFAGHFSNSCNNHSNHVGTGMIYDTWAEELKACHLIPDLENHGFIKRKAPEINKFDLVKWEHTTRGAMVGVVQPRVDFGKCGVLCVSEDGFGKVFAVSEHRLTKIEIR